MKLFGIFTQFIFEIQVENKLSEEIEKLFKLN